MDIAIAGSGPAASAIRGACEDVDATVREAAPDALGSAGLAAVVAPVGSDAFAVADESCTRWVAVEIGGLGGESLGIDAGVTVFDDGGDGPNACFDCLRARVASNSNGEGPDRPSGDRSAVRFAGAVAGRELVRLLAGEARGGTVVEIPGAERTLLPVPGCCSDARERALERGYREVGLDDALARAERALDDRVGPISDVGERESFPLPYYLAMTADTTAFSEARAAEYAAGVDTDWDRAFMKALGEGLERYAAGVYRRRAFTSAPERTRANAVSPRAFVRPEGHTAPDPDEPIPWVEGEDLADRSSVWLPAEVVHYPPPGDRITPAITTGLGLGNSGTEALLSGLYEVVERDASMLSWYSTFDPLGLAVEGAGYAEVEKRARAEGLTATPLLLTQDVDVPVVGAAVHREGAWPNFAMGSAADLDASAAARDALAEALQNWLELRGMGPEAAREEEAAIGEYADLPRPARRFIDADSTVPADSVGPEDVPTGEAELDAVVERVGGAGLDAYAASLTTRDLAALGFEAVRVICPAAQPLFTGEPFFGERARTVPEDLGFEADLDRSYHPFP